MRKKEWDIKEAQVKLLKVGDIVKIIYYKDFGYGIVMKEWSSGIGIKIFDFRNKSVYNILNMNILEIM